MVGKVTWIGVDKGDKVKQGQVLVRLEDDEYQAHFSRPKASLANLKARLRNSSTVRGPKRSLSAADLESGQSGLENAKVTLDRNRHGCGKVLPKQTLDDAQGALRSRAVAQMNSLEKLRTRALGPRQEQIDAVRGQVVEAPRNA